LADPTASTTDPSRPTDSLGPADGEPVTDASPVAHPEPGAADLGRRRFFRQFAGELANTAATVVGAAQALQRTSAELAGAILDPTRLDVDSAAAAATESAAMSTFRTAFRVDGSAIHLIDQRALPRSVAEHTVVSAAEASYAIRNGVVLGGPAMGQAAAYGLALTAARVRNTRPYARRATLRGAANALVNAAAGFASVKAAVDRSMAAYAAVGELDEDGGRIADAMLAEAERIVGDATADHGRLVEAGLAALRALPAIDDQPLRILVHGQSGTLAGGQVGTALAVVIAAHHAGREIRVVVPEARPGFDGTRVTCWELAAAGVPYVLVADAAAASLLAAGEIDAILVAADGVAANGDLGAAVGTYPLAVVAARHGVPVYATAPASTFAPAVADGSQIETGQRPAELLDRVGDIQLAPRGTEVRVPAHDMTPAGLVTAFITGDGLREPPFADATEPGA
jgi:methylthioribose-1-phosphate isomerase